MESCCSMLLQHDDEVLMATTIPTRVDRDLLDSARIVGDRLSRSAPQQLAHWARIGREIELGSSVTQSTVADALSGRTSYDDLNPEEQAVVRAHWAVRAAELLAKLNLAEEFAIEGRTYVELDDMGRVVLRSANGNIVEIDGKPIHAK